MTRRPETRDTHLHIRAKRTDRDLFDRAAAVAGQSRSELILAAARTHAQSILMEQRLITLDADAWKRFTRALDAPPQVIPELAALLTRKPVWAK